MKYDPDKHHRRSIRLKGYDYAGPGAYFVTIVAQNRAGLFGEVMDGKMLLNDAVRMVHREWSTLPARFTTVRLDAFIIMPNHCHGIIMIEPPVGATLVVPRSHRKTGQGLWKTGQGQALPLRLAQMWAPQARM